MSRIIVSRSVRRVRRVEQDLGLGISPYRGEHLVVLDLPQVLVGEDEPEPVFACGSQGGSLSCGSPRLAGC